MSALSPEQREALVRAIYCEHDGHPSQGSSARCKQRIQETADRIERLLTEAKAEAWVERDRARPRYLGPDNGHYHDCMGWEDCHCATYPNPYAADTDEGTGE